MDEEYDIMPHSAFSKLKKEVDELKNAPTTDKMMKSIESLNQSISSMMELFRAAGEEMKIEQRQTETFNEQVKPLMDKLDKVIDQNQKIAKGMVAIADMVNEAIPRLEEKVDNISSPKMPEMPRPAPMQAPRPMPREMPKPEINPPGFPPMPEEEPDFGEPNFNEPDFGMPPSRGPMMPPPGAMPQPRMPAPPGMPGPMPPPGMGGMPPAGPGYMPPPPPRFEDKKKKGLLGMFRK